MALFCALLSSCTNDLQEGEIRKSDGDVNVRVVLQMPNAAAPKTYAISEIDENHVEQIDVLAFAPDASKPSGWAYAYRARGGPVTDRVDNDAIKSKKQSNVTLIKSAKPQRFAILANVRTQVEALGDIAVGADKDALLERLVFDHAGSWNANNGRPDDDPSKTFTPFPMWGEVTSIINDATTQLNNIKMLRGIARMDVLLDAAVGNFKLDEIYIYNSKSKGQIVPDSANLENLSKVKAATLPAGSINNAAALRYAVPPAMDRLFERSIYLFEAQAVPQNESSRATCMVVGGTYGTDGRTTYYRIDFFAKDANNNVTKDYADILRNHRYRVNIIKVSGSGYPTPEDAFNSRPLNMEVDVEEWNDGDMKDVIFDGQNFIAVSPGSFMFYKNAITSDEGDNRLTIHTDVPGGWKIDLAKISYQSGGTGWLTPSATSGGTTKQTIWLGVTENSSGVERTAIIPVSAGRLNYNVKVTQSTQTKALPLFQFMSFTNVSDPGSSWISALGGEIRADTYTNTTWWLKSNDDATADLEIASASTSPEPSFGSLHFGPNLSWNPRSIDVWVECRGVNFSGITYGQYAAYNIALAAPSSIARAGGNTTFTLTGLFPAMNIRALAGSQIVGAPALCTAAASGTGTVTLNIAANTTGASRTVTLEYEKSPGTWVNLGSVTQSVVTLPTAGILAPPGVLGVGAESGKLTLDGSKEYPARGSSPAGAAGETVYVVYFKWGSTVALSAGGGGNKDAFDNTDVCWVPPGFTGTIDDNWSSVPYKSSGNFPAQNNAGGLGDPCKLAVRNSVVGNYRMPRGNPYEQFTDGGWANRYNASVQIPGRWSDFGGTKSQFYPAAGYRDLSAGLFDGFRDFGNYWSVSPQSTNSSYDVNFNSTNLYPNNFAARGYGFSIRCVLE